MNPQSRMARGVYPFSVVLAAFLVGVRCPAADWPQFMRNPAHTGDATEEELRLPLGLATQVRLDDAVMTSPAVVGERAYGGGEVAVSGKRIVTSFGWDIVCLEHAATEAKLLWCNRAPTGGNGTAPMSPSISGDWIYAAGMGADGVMGMTRLSLLDGQVSKTSGDIKNYAPKVEAVPWSTPAVRGTAAAGREFQGQYYSKNGIALYDLETGKPLVKWRDDKDATPIVTSHALAKEHLVATTLRGEVLVFDVTVNWSGAPFRFRTPNGKGIGSSPVISGGRICFGCDDGYFYVLGRDGNLRPQADGSLALHEPRGRVRSATQRTYGWPSTGGNPANTYSVNDPDLKPPLRVRWATRAFGHFKAPCIAYEGDVISVTLQGVLTCQEQATGRMRWRMAMPGPESWTGAGLLADACRLFVARPIYGQPEGIFHCLDLHTGRILWSAKIGGRHIWERSSPLVAGSLVVFGSTQPNSSGPPGAMVQAWEAATGKPAWQVDLKVHSNRIGDIAGCTDGKDLLVASLGMPGEDGGGST